MDKKIDYNINAKEYVPKAKRHDVNIINIGYRICNSSTGFK